MLYNIRNISSLLQAKFHEGNPEHSVITSLLTDSRKIAEAHSTLFFAIKGERHNGHEYIQKLIEQGVVNFVVSEARPLFENLPANFIYVNDVVSALQILANHHRHAFALPVLAITGSNGKTIIKEWLFQLLRQDLNIVRSPKSYNSQIGVPLSLWQINDDHELAIIEAGISMLGEMHLLQTMIDPDSGIITNIGTAHDEFFTDHTQKATEKLKLFVHSRELIYCKDDLVLHSLIKDQDMKSEILPPALQRITWSKKTKADLQVGRTTSSNGSTTIQAIWKNDFIDIVIPFTDEASIENAIFCWCYLLQKGLRNEVIKERMLQLVPVAMRLEMKQGINNTSVINDSYNSDTGSLAIALDFIKQQQQHQKRTLILSDILQSNLPEEDLYKEVATLIQSKKINRMIGIGEALSRQKKLFQLPSEFFSSTDEFIEKFNSYDFNDETILIKGARVFSFEKIVKLLQQKSHETVLEVNLNAMVHNLNYYRSILSPNTKIMAMVKAFSYGSGSFEIASLLQFHHVDYLAVAYTDEGVTLRKAGITLPIMVMNPELQSFEIMIQHQLEPEIYNFRLLNQLSDVVSRQHHQKEICIHLKLDTGMHRLGFEEQDMVELIQRIKTFSNIKIKSVFTHLAATDESEHDGFTKVQLERYEEMCKTIKTSLHYSFIKHALNSAGVARFKNAHYDMVRLGIGLYGQSSLHEIHKLQQVATLKTSISQIKIVKANESIGYSRMGKASKEMRIATVAIGYADGYNRRFSNGIGGMMVNGKVAPVIGNVCMDMCMLDITNIEAKEGDEVIVFGNEITVSEMARAIQTIPYEILTNISQRVKRVYYQE